MHQSRLCLTFAEEKKPGMERSGPAPTTSLRLAGPAGAAQEEHLLLERNASAAGLHDESRYISALDRVCI